MSGKGKRRSARLLKLEEQKNDDDDTAAAAADSGPAAVCLLDPWQIIRNSITGATRGKRKRNDEIQVKRTYVSQSQSNSHQYQLFRRAIFLFMILLCICFFRGCSREKLRVAKQQMRPPVPVLYIVSGLFLVVSVLCCYHY